MTIDVKLHARGGGAPTSPPSAALPAARSGDTVTRPERAAHAAATDGVDLPRPKSKREPLQAIDALRTPQAPLARSSAAAGDWRDGFDDQRALRVLTPQVDGTSDPSALMTLVTAYARFVAAHPEKVTKPYVYFVDFGLPNTTPRGWILDMKALRVADGPFNVAHGAGSGPRNGVPRHFSNRDGSKATALGVYTTGETYDFVGHANKRRYESVGLRLDGWSGRFNEAARGRRIVAHGAPYVTTKDAGRSEGCPAMEMGRAAKWLPVLAKGAVLFLYSPHDADWLSGDPWVTGR